MSQILRIPGRPSDLGDGLTVLRALPTVQRRMVGPWCFLDHIGPVDFTADSGLHVGAHPHIGLQTFTWMIKGELLHRDSLGNEQIIRPGQVNLMTAGHGIVHTEDSLLAGQRLHAAQLWIALPEHAANCPPAFDHYPELPSWEEADHTLTLLAGSFAGRTMPGNFHSPLLGLDAFSKRGGDFKLSLNPGFEYGILALEGELRIGEMHFKTDDFAYLGTGAEAINIDMAAGTRILLLGGKPFDVPVQIWWNFVATSKTEITKAQDDWEKGNPRFGRVKGAEGRRLVAPRIPWSA